MTLKERLALLGNALSPDSRRFAVPSSVPNNRSAFDGPGFYELTALPGVAVYVGAMPPRWPYGRSFLQAHERLSTFPSPELALIVFPRREAGKIIRQKLCEIAS